MFATRARDYSAAEAIAARWLWREVQILNVRNLGVGDYWDVYLRRRYLIAQGIVDRDRFGAMGWSRAANISAFITCSSDRLQAVSGGAGISDG